MVSAHFDIAEVTGSNPVVPIWSKIIYEDEDLLVIDKPAGVNSDDFEKRVHRLDKDTSGIFLVAKNDRALDFLQKQFKERKVKKNYLALVVGNLKDEEGLIETLIGRSPGDKRKQKVYLPQEPAAQGKREAVTRYKVLQRFKNYTREIISCQRLKIMI